MFYVGLCNNTHQHWTLYKIFISEIINFIKYYLENFIEISIKKSDIILKSTCLILSEI